MTGKPPSDMLYCFLYRKTGECILLQRAVKRMQFFKKIRIGQRAVKTALSVGIALAVAQILGSSLPIFAAIGAISVMSRTWSDSLKESLTQVAGTFLGYLIACAVVLWLPWRPQFFLWMAGGTLCVNIRQFMLVLGASAGGVLSDVVTRLLGS